MGSIIGNAILVCKGLLNHPMAEGRKVRVMSKFLWWQLIEKHIAGEGRIKNWLGGVNYLFVLVGHQQQEITIWVY